MTCLPAGMAYTVADDEEPIDCSLFLTQELCETTEECVWEIEDEIGTCVSAPEEPIEEPPLSGELEEPAVNQTIQIDSPAEGSKASLLQTYGTKFLIRGKEALTWSLNIEDAGFHNPAIQTSYTKVLTIVNSLFVLGLLVIAAMWMFTIIIPRRYLKQVILYFAAAVIFVNFALPLTRLLIDSTNLLQKTLLTQEGENIVITDIVETPAYEQAVGYENLTTEESTKEINIALTDDPDAEEVVIGKISGPEREITGTAIGMESMENINLTMSEADGHMITLNPNQTIIMPSESEFHPETEQSIFSFFLIVATGLAYFVLALIFILRIVILWALLILSPILFLLGIFRLTRGWFWNWLAIYGKWLLIGPLVALGIAVIVNIWKTVGLPITVNPEFTGDTFQSVSNISFLLPGGTVPNTLSNTSEMMEYLVFLMMLYIPIFFAFALTRQKMLRGAATAVVEKWRERRPVPVTPTEQRTGERIIKETQTQGGVLGTLKDMFTGQMAKITATAIPEQMRTAEIREAPIIPSADKFLPENLATTDIRDMMELLGASKQSRRSRDLTVERLANPAILQDSKEREKHTTVRNEIEKRAETGDPEAVILMNEIREKETSVAAPVTEVPTEVTVTAPEAEVETKIEVTAPEAQEAVPTIERVIEEKETEVREKETVVVQPPEEKPAEELEPKPEEEEEKEEEKPEEEKPEKDEEQEKPEETEEKIII